MLALSRKTEFGPPHANSPRSFFGARAPSDLMQSPRRAVLFGERPGEAAGCGGAGVDIVVWGGPAGAVYELGRSDSPRELSQIPNKMIGPPRSRKTVGRSPRMDQARRVAKAGSPSRLIETRGALACLRA
jgi:hypothetical protein